MNRVSLTRPNQATTASAEATPATQKSGDGATRPVDDERHEGRRHVRLTRSPLVEPARQGTGQLITSDPLQPHRSARTAPSGSRRPGDDDVAAIALVEALGQRQARHSERIELAEPSELTACTFVGVAERLAYAQRARSQSGPVTRANGVSVGTGSRVQ
jgi:hypothetical protein